MFLHIDFWILFLFFAWDLNFLDLGSYFTDILAQIWFHNAVSRLPCRHYGQQGQLGGAASRDQLTEWLP